MSINLCRVVLPNIKLQDKDERKKMIQTRGSVRKEIGKKRGWKGREIAIAFILFSDLLFCLLKGRKTHLHLNCFQWRRRTLQRTPHTRKCTIKNTHMCSCASRHMDEHSEVCANAKFISCLLSSTNTHSMSFCVCMQCLCAFD